MAIHERNDCPKGRKFNASQRDRRKEVGTSETDDPRLTKNESSIGQRQDE